MLWTSTWTMSCTAGGTRVVQKALKVAVSRIKWPEHDGTHTYIYIYSVDWLNIYRKPRFLLKYRGLLRIFPSSSGMNVVKSNSHGGFGVGGMGWGPFWDHDILKVCCWSGGHFPQCGYYWGDGKPSWIQGVQDQQNW